MVDLTSRESMDFLSWMMILSGAATMGALLFGFRAQYGRYAEEGWFKISARMGWFLQEFPSFAFGVFGYHDATTGGGKLVIALFLIHYINRTFIFPCQLNNPKPAPVLLVVAAAAFTSWNGYLQGFYHAWYMKWPAGHFSSPITLAGLALFFGGMAINLHSDHVLRNLRKPGETEYKIPRGGMFEYVSGANYFGECVEWIGFAVVARTLPSWAFAFFTISNIGPRALQHHSWYKGKFRNYPQGRKALVPFLL